MRSGHVFLEQNTSDEELVSVKGSRMLPDPHNPRGGRRIVWVGLFRDRDAAVMHAHNRLCRKLVDIDRKLYRAPVAQAIAALETDILPHKQVYIDPALDVETLENRDRWMAYYRKRRQRLETIVSWIRIAAIGLLLVNLVFGLSG